MSIPLKAKLEKKLEEHTEIIKQVANDIEIFHDQMRLLQSNPDKKKEMITAATASMALKDKILFHKAAILTLQDVLAELP